MADLLDAAGMVISHAVCFGAALYALMVFVVVHAPRFSASSCLEICDHLKDWVIQS